VALSGSLGGLAGPPSLGRGAASRAKGGGLAATGRGGAAEVEALLSQLPDEEALSAVEREALRKELIEQWLSEIAHARVTYVPPRPLLVRVAEGIGCVGFLILLPWVMEMANNDFVSMKRSYGMVAAGFFALCAGLYALPLLRRSRGWPVAVFWIWWVLPTLVLVPVGGTLAAKSASPIWTR
jgi:hypothetical protein